MSWARATASEEAECMVFFGLVERYERAVPALRYLTHVPNGKQRSKAAGGQLKAMGVRKGVPDYVLFARSGDYIGFAFEFKVEGEQPSPAQDDWITFLQNAGWKTAVFFHAEDALTAVLGYLGSRVGMTSSRRHAAA